ncbi:hypothetical protein Btru_071905 [Bulinus truncatus]|nr:hypothetical protein Btru_071905 [Bulinus truncatus]
MEVLAKEVIMEKVKLFQEEMCIPCNAEDMIKLDSTLEDLKHLILSNKGDKTFSINMAASAKDLIMEKVKLFQNEMCYASTVEDMEKLDSKLEDLKELIDSNKEEKTFSFTIRTLAGRLSDLREEIEHDVPICALENELRELEEKVTIIQIPVVKNPGERFDALRLDAAMLELRISDHKDECYAIGNLKQAVSDIKEKIEFLVKDNISFIAWLSANTALTGASIGVAFIPLVGLPISAGLIAIPYLAKLGHRLGVSYKRKKRFTKKNNKK